ncbi:MAG: PAS domain S-box protein, partial [Candidatus Hydrogenedentota bacterium]
GAERAVLNVLRDTTERKRAEEALRVSEERYRNIFWEAPDIFYTLDLETWIITDANKYALETLEYGPEMIGKIHVSEIIHPDDFERATNRLREMVIKKDRQPNFPLRILTRTGKVLHIEQSGVIFWGEDERAESFLGLARDVTERNRMEFQLQQSSKLAAIGELATGVAHEINNPLATIDVQTGLMHDIVEDEQEELPGDFLRRVGEYLRLVENQVKRCQSVTNDLLSFSRSPENKQETFAINDLLKKTVEILMHLTDKQPKLEMILDEQLPRFQSDPIRLEQVFVNLLSNALRAIPFDGQITIITRLEDDGTIRIEFRDSGHGIPSEIKDHIFDPFFTTRPVGEGTGLGLSISYYIIKQMNGRLDFESSPGQGTTFTITLPRENKAEESGSHVS